MLFIVPFFLFKRIRNEQEKKDSVFLDPNFKVFDNQLTNRNHEEDSEIDQEPAEKKDVQVKQKRSRHSKRKQKARNHKDRHHGDESGGYNENGSNMPFKDKRSEMKFNNSTQPLKKNEEMQQKLSLIDSEEDEQMDPMGNTIQRAPGSGIGTNPMNNPQGPNQTQNNMGNSRSHDFIPQMNNKMSMLPSLMSNTVGMSSGNSSMTPDHGGQSPSKSKGVAPNLFGQSAVAPTDNGKGSNAAGNTSNQASTGKPENTPANSVFNNDKKPMERSPSDKPEENKKPQDDKSKAVPILHSSYHSPMSTSLFNKTDPVETIKKQIDDKIKETTELINKLTEMKKQSDKPPEERIDYKIIEVTDEDK